MNYRFILVNIRSYRSHSDSGVFHNTRCCDKCKKWEVNIPLALTLPGDNHGKEMPYIFVDTKGFPSRHDLLQPYLGIRAGHEFTDDEKNYNHRLSRARTPVGNAFTILVQRLQTHMGQMIFSPVMFNVVDRVQNWDYDNKDHCVFAPISNMVMHNGLLASTVRENFKHNFITKANRVSCQEERADVNIQQKMNK